MRNRAIQVKLVKADDESKEPTLTAGHVAVMAQEVCINITIGVLFYLAADTARQTILHVVRTKIN